jgi:hypothetical protein
MAKKIDIKRTLGSPTPSFNVDAIEEMTRMIHTKKVADAAVAQTVISEAKQSIPEKIVTEKVKSADKIETKGKVVKKVAAKEIVTVELPTVNKRGRKPNPPATDERMVRVSVDLPESIFIKLKIKVIQEKTDMKTWAWRLIEKELSK